MSASAVVLDRARATATDELDRARERSHPLPEHKRELRDGTVVTVDATGVELRDARGALLVRYRDGQTEISSPRGDLLLCAPQGSVLLRAADDVRLEAGGQMELRAAEAFRLEVDDGGRIEVEPGRSRISAGQLQLDGGTVSIRAGRIDVVAERLHRWVDHVRTQAKEVELVATSLVEQAEDVVRSVKHLLSTRAGRARTEVEDVMTVRTGRTVMRSEHETSIEAERVLLG